MDSKPIKNSFALRIIILAGYLLSILFLTTPALSFNAKLITAVDAIANGTATEGQKALAYRNYNTVQNMRYQGPKNGGIGENTYQKFSESFFKKNDRITVKSGAENGVKIKFQPRSGAPTPGTDTDAIGNIKSMKQLQNTNKSYNSRWERYYKENGINVSGNENFRKTHNTDIMVDSKGVSKSQFKAMNKTMPGTTYQSPGAANYEAMKNAAGPSGKFRPSLSDSNDYMKEQRRIIGEKGKAANAKLKEAQELNKNPASKIKGTKAWTKSMNVEAELHFNQADQGKAINRLQSVGKDLAKAHNVDTPKYSKLPDIGKIRGEGQLPKSAPVKALDKYLTQQALKNNAEVYTDIGQKNPSLRYKTNQMIKESTKNLPFSQKGDLIESTRNKYGNDAAKNLAKEMKKTSSGAKGKPAIVPSGGWAGDGSFTLKKSKLSWKSLKPTSLKTGVVGKAVGVAGIALIGLQVYDLIDYGNKTGDWKTVKEQGAKMAVTTVGIMGGVKILTAAAPATVPALAVVATGAVAYQGTREIIERVPGAKSIDTLTTKILYHTSDATVYVSRHEDQTDLALQSMLLKAIKSQKWQLPEGMTNAEAFKLALNNSSNRKKPVLGFLVNAQAQARRDAELKAALAAAEEKLRMDSEKLKAELKAEEEARTKAQNEAKLKATTESPSVTVSKTEVPPKKWADMTKDERKEALTTGQDGAWQSHLDAIIKAQKSEKVAETGGYNPTKDPEASVTTDPNLIAKVDEISKKFQQETPTGQTSTQTNGALGGGSISPQSSAYTGGQIGGNTGATVGGGNVGAGIPITVGGIPTLGTPVPTTGGANVGGGTAAGTGAAKPGGATSGSGTGANVGGTGTGKQQCSITEMCSVLPSSAQLGVKSGLMTQCARQSGTQTTFTKSWSTGGGSRSVNITMTIYPTIAAAQADVQNYGASCGNGCTPVNIGNGGFKTTNITYPYFKIYSNNVVITYSSHKATRKAIPAQDNYVSNIAQKINALNCQPSP